MVLSGRRTRKTLRDFMVLMSLPLLFLWVFTNGVSQLGICWQTEIHGHTACKHVENNIDKQNTHVSAVLHTIYMATQEIKQQDRI